MIARDILHRAPRLPQVLGRFFDLLFCLSGGKFTPTVIDFSPSPAWVLGKRALAQWNITLWKSLSNGGFAQRFHSWWKSCTALQTTAVLIPG
ncbi:hypothetical protein THICB1_80109 [Thiomonas arsenitoxydans]|uniref:Uncharacterized protein n=1 Tax=Thiomonas arsenitoxydans (strain DSM 22701 / CIP 110005 / 3As) TaxID=426114 RepID=A0ABM9T958_THIA3|nr:hypothetical protein ACO7_490055 [Thiomonas arsenitoxydans]CQR36426.1 hypothetical protein ACO3_490055 [Thiomonas arsenitoxydans]CQR37494.1 hypothetical protein THICB6_40116 [Thiomonas arsenitoxydans]CQR38988.1 hypothetical protein THICB1_80109 [Thiomonas arsenitoxydans]